MAAYYVVSESLTNIGKHAERETRAFGSRDRLRLVVEVVDDGIGGADTERGSGIRGLADRVEALGGACASGLRAAAARAWKRRSRARSDRRGQRVCSARASARLLDDAGFDVVAQCEDADDLLLKVAAHSPDVAIVDIRLPPTHTDEGLRAALEIRSKHPSVGVLVLSQYVELGLALKLLADSAEGVGYLLKDRISDVDEFVDALRRVADGGSAIDPMIVSTLVSRQRTGRPAGAADAARAGGARADGAGSVEPGDRERPRDHRAGRREVRLQHLSASSGCRRPAASRGGCSRCSRSCAADARANRKTPETRPPSTSPPAAPIRGRGGS